MASRVTIFLALGLVLLGGCTTVSVPANSPYFAPDQIDGKALQSLIRKQDAQIAKCTVKMTCDHVYFARALAALYDSQEIALRHFEKVIAVAPKSHLAASSKLWIQLLHQGMMPPDPSWIESVFTGPTLAKNNAVLNQATERTVRDLLDRELVIQQLRSLQEVEAQSVESLHRELQEQEKKVEALSSKREPSKVLVEAGALQSLQRQVSDRDRKIEELTGQLEALKRIDQEMREKIRPIKPPSNTAPPLVPEPIKP
jgi:hypothetical protein